MVNPKNGLTILALPFLQSKTVLIALQVCFCFYVAWYYLQRKKLEMVEPSKCKTSLKCSRLLYSCSKFHVYNIQAYIVSFTFEFWISMWQWTSNSRTVTAGTLGWGRLKNRRHCYLPTASFSNTAVTFANSTYTHTHDAKHLITLLKKEALHCLLWLS